jgi:hypothetical protein
MSDLRNNEIAAAVYAVRTQLIVPAKLAPGAP